MRNDTNVEKQLFSTREAARYLGISEISLRKMRCMGALPNHRTPVPYVHLGGKSVKYLKADLDNYIAKHRVVPKSWAELEEAASHG